MQKTSPELALQPVSPPTAVVACLALCTLLPMLATSMANVSLPALSQAFSLPFDRVQWVVLAYLLALSALIVPAGRLGDVLGRRRVLLAGLYLFIAGALLGGMAPGFGYLLLARLLQGAGSALLLAQSMALAASLVPAGRSGRLIGLLGSMSAVGVASGPALGGVLLAVGGWRWVLLAGLLPAVLAWWLAQRHLPKTAAHGDLSVLDWVGTLWLGLALCAYALGTSGGLGPWGWPQAALLLFAALSGWQFYRVQQRVPRPLIAAELWQQPALLSGLLLSVLVSAVMMATLVVGPFYLVQVLRLDAVSLGLAMSLGPLCAALCGAPAGRLLEHFGSQRMMAWALAGMALAALLLALPVLPWTLWAYVAPMTLLCGSYAVFQTANNTAVMMPASGERRGLVSGVLNLSRHLGLMTGAALMGSLFVQASGSASLHQALPAAVATGKQWVFALSLLLLVGACWHVLRRMGSLSELTPLAAK